MKTLIKSNRYLRDPETRKRLLEENARESSVFEGARGLGAAKRQPSVRKRRSIASRKK